MDRNISYDLADYLSLRWKYSTLDENKFIKQCADGIRNRLYARFRVRGCAEVLNLFEIVENLQPPPRILFQRPGKSREEVEIEELILKEPLEVIQKKYNYDMKYLRDVRIAQINTKLRELESNGGLDFKAKIFLKSSNMIAKLLRDEELDYSAITIGYAKFFEREINLSIVQLIRRELGINMPKYFEVYFDSDDLYIVNVRDGFFVNFNMLDKSSRKYLPPGLGQSLISYSLMAERLVEYIPKYKYLLSKGKVLNSIRNKSAHPEIIGQKDVIKIKEIIAELYVNGVFDNLFNVKSALKA